MWTTVIIASLFSYALAKTFINNHSFEAKVKDLKARGALRYNDLQEHRLLKKEGYDIHYFISGNKENELLIFIPAAFCDHKTFDSQVAYFSQNYRVITIDLIGHGLSKVKGSKDKIDASADHLLQIMELEGYTKVHIVGVSMGSLIGQYFAYLYPEKTASLTVVGGYSIHSDNSEISRAQLSEKLKWPLKILVSMDSFRRYVATVAATKPEEQAKVYESTKGFTRGSFKVMQGLSKLETAVNQPRNKYPLLLLVGDRDMVVSIKNAEKWDSEDADSLFYIIKNAGHNANMDNPDDFNRILADFISFKPVLL